MGFKNEDVKKEYHRKWYQENKERQKALSQKRYQELKDNPVKYQERLDKIKEKGSNRQGYYNRKAKQIQLLGGQCVKCHTTENLEINHRNLADTILNKKVRPTIQDIKEGIDVELLCHECHKDWTSSQRKAAYELLASLPLEEQIRLTQKHSSKGSNEGA